MLGRTTMSLRRRIGHFLAIGALLFAGDRMLAERFGSRGTARASVGPAGLSVASLERLRTGWLRDAGRPPTASEWEHLVAAEIDDELLLREARRRGFHRSDALVRRRLVRNVEFASERPGDSHANLREAIELGLDETDLVVRRRLIQKMRLLSHDSEPPSDEELRRYFAQHRDRFERGERIDIQHIFFARERRVDAGRDARRALAKRDPGDWNPQQDRGDPFIAGNRTGLVSRAELAKQFGEPFAEAAFDVERGRWQGPIASSFGWHLVWVHDRRGGWVPPLEVVRAEVSEALSAERSRSALRELLDELRAEMRDAPGQP